MNSVADVWDNVLSQLKGELSETTIATWFDELEAVDIQGNTFILHCSNDFKKGYIESLFMKNIKASLHDIFSTDFEVKILDDLDYAELKDNRPHRQSERFTSAEFTFETFVVGPSNKLAYAASVSVAEHPAQNYNPLLIYGDSGLGKTHLIYAIANVIRRNDPRSKIAYVKGDDLTNELVDAIREGKTAEMREKYRQADLLLVDDVQFIAGKKQTQNCLFSLRQSIFLHSCRNRHFPAIFTKFHPQLLQSVSHMIFQHINNRNIIIAKILFSDRSVKCNHPQEMPIPAHYHLQRILPVIFLVYFPIQFCLPPFAFRNHICKSVHKALPTFDHPPAVFVLLIIYLVLHLTIVRHRLRHFILLIMSGKIKICTVKINHQPQLFQKFAAHLIQIFCCVNFINNTV